MNYAIAAVNTYWDAMNFEEPCEACGEDINYDLPDWAPNSAAVAHATPVRSPDHDPRVLVVVHSKCARARNLITLHLIRPGEPTTYEVHYEVARAKASIANAPVYTDITAGAPARGATSDNRLSAGALKSLGVAVPTDPNDLGPHWTCRRDPSHVGQGRRVRTTGQEKCRICEAIDKKASRVARARADAERPVE